METLLRTHEGPEKRELPAALRGGRAAPRQLAELLQLSVEEVCAEFNAMLRHVLLGL